MADRVRRRREGIVAAEAVAPAVAFVVDDGLGEFFWRCRCSSSLLLFILLLLLLLWLSYVSNVIPLPVSPFGDGCCCCACRLRKDVDEGFSDSFFLSASLLSLLSLLMMLLLLSSTMMVAVPPSPLLLLSIFISISLGEEFIRFRERNDLGLFDFPDLTGFSESFFVLDCFGIVDFEFGEADETFLLGCFWLPKDLSELGLVWLLRELGFVGLLKELGLGTFAFSLRYEAC